MKGWKIAVISVVSAVVVLGAGTGIAYAASDTVKNFAKMNFSSESDYYQWVIEKIQKTGDVRFLTATIVPSLAPRKNRNPICL